MHRNLQFVAALAISLSMLPGISIATEIKIQNLAMQPPAPNEARSEQLLIGEVAGVDITHIALSGPISHNVSPPEGCDTVLLFIQGQATLRVEDDVYAIDSEVIAVPFSTSPLEIEVADGDTLHFLNIQKQLSPQDRNDLDEFSARKNARIYIKKFEDCQPYTEAIKSPKTVSRTVLPKDHVPRVAMGTVATAGPDAVGAHEHPMLDQLFLGLAKNECLVHADYAQVAFPAFSILHIPLGSRHGVKVEEGNRMYYMWMDFFLTTEGQEWLKTHKPVRDQAAK
jgi:hypothetical protein